MKTKTTWREKLVADHGLPRVERIKGPWVRRLGAGTMVIPAPREVDAMMRRVPKGRLTTINRLREVLARGHGASVGCPITTGIFAWIAAGAAAEDEAAGRKRITPYWRTLKAGGALNPKYPGGVASQRGRLAAEGHVVRAKGKQWVVVDYERALAKL